MSNKPYSKMTDEELDVAEIKWMGHLADASGPSSALFAKKQRNLIRAEFAKRTVTATDTLSPRYDSASFEEGERSMRDAAMKVAAQYVAYNPNTKFAVIKTHIAQRILDKLRKLPIKSKSRRS